jgi:hypothetical protein
MPNDTTFHDPAGEVGALVKLILSPPIMGFAGGSATEERALDRWKAQALAELERLRRVYGPPSLGPELHAFLDAAERVLRP